MKKDEILNTLSEQKSYLVKNFEVDKIGLFGSYARDEATNDSDIDIYVEFKNKTFDNIAGLWVYLEELYHKKIDLIHWHKRANKVIMSNIQKEVIYG
ncbi:MAG: nucleotidyltransferase domain-containing protein [Campylobacterales bacterium]|nr:nucleotidyltransferase domain-containing protein [Campylobacterales bacterium]